MRWMIIALRTIIDDVYSTFGLKLLEHLNTFLETAALSRIEDRGLEGLGNLWCRKIELGDI